MQDRPSLPEIPASPHPLTDAIRAGLRRATPADAAAVRDLTRAAYAKWVPVLGREPKPMTADYDAAVRDHIVDMLHLDGELAALMADCTKPCKSETSDYNGLCWGCDRVHCT